MATTVTLGSLKGGVGKTSVAINLAAAWSMKAKRVLLVDADPQGSTTHLFASAAEDSAMPEHTLGDLLDPKKELSTREAIMSTPVPNLDLIAAVYDTLEPVERMNAISAMHGIGRVLRPIKDDYDAIVIDTPPRLSVLTDAAIIASQWAVAVTPPSMIDNSGASRFTDRVAEVVDNVGSGASMAGWIGNRWSLDSAEARFIDEYARAEQWPLLQPLLPSTRLVGKSFLEVGTPAVIAYPNRPFSLAMVELAENLWKQVT